MVDLTISKLDLCELISRLSQKEITSEEATKACLEQIRKYDQSIGSFLWVDEALALQQAKSSDERRKKGLTKGNLDGVPIAVKDMFVTTDMPTTAASKILEGYRSPYDATVVQKLKEAGAVIIGKTNQDEFAMGSSNENSAFKACLNPWDLTRTPGGSSGGSAASVAAGMCFASMGTDTGGSIRQPAAFCGIAGIKPTYGRVSRYGIIAFASSLDQAGPFARTAKGCAHVLSAISGYDPKDATTVNLSVPDYAGLLNGDLKNYRVGVPKEFFGKAISPEIQGGVEKAIAVLKDRGAEVVEISLPHTPYAIATYYIIATAEASSNLSRYDGVRYGPRLGDGKDLLHLYEETRGLFGKEVKRRIALGTYVLSAGYYDAYYLRAQKVRRLFADDFKKAFEQVQVIISPTTPTSAFRLGEKMEDPLAMYLNDINTGSANLAGIPGISIHVGFSNEGLPLGCQFMAKPFDEQTLFNVASVVEEDLGLSKFPKSCFPEQGV